MKVAIFLPRHGERALAYVAVHSKHDNKAQLLCNPDSEFRQDLEEPLRGLCSLDNTCELQPPDAHCDESIHPNIGCDAHRAILDLHAAANVGRRQKTYTN